MRQLAAALALVPVPRTPPEAPRRARSRPGWLPARRTTLAGRAVRVRRGTVLSLLHGDEEVLRLRLVAEEAYEVELRGHEVHGRVADGDLLEAVVRGRPGDGDRIRVRRLRNLTTGGVVTVR